MMNYALLLAWTWSLLLHNCSIGARNYNDPEKYVFIDVYVSTFPMPRNQLEILRINEYLNSRELWVQFSVLHMQRNSLVMLGVCLLLSRMSLTEYHEIEFIFLNSKLKFYAMSEWRFYYTWFLAHENI